MQKQPSLEVQQKVLHSPFDIETHKNTFVSYLEVVISPEGTVDGWDTALCKGSSQQEPLPQRLAFQSPGLSRLGPEAQFSRHGGEDPRALSPSSASSRVIFPV